MGNAYFLVGATASGKSAIAQYIAEREGQLIVSADSMNLYRGMDIGTAKPTADERSRVDYAGIDIAEPIEKFNVASYLESVRPVLKTDRETIVVGGTGLYVKCLTEGFDDVPPENEVLRAELEALEYHALEKRAKKDAPDLYETLTEDDQQNPRRLIRILERANGRDGSQDDPNVGSWNSKPKPKLVGLKVEREVLLERIVARVESMYQRGLIDEAKELSKLDLSQTAMQAIGYAEAFAVLKNEMTQDEAKEQTIIRTRQLAKRQMTWFRNQLNIEWIDAALYPDIQGLAEAVSNAWEKIGPTPLVLN